MRSLRQALQAREKIAANSKEGRMTIREVIRKFIEENFVLFDRAMPLGDHDSLLDAGIVDSTGVLELITFIEDTFGIELLDDELVPENLDSIQRISQFVTRKAGVAETVT